jgi:hypothetical protein
MHPRVFERVVGVARWMYKEYGPEVASERMSELLDNEQRAMLIERLTQKNKNGRPRKT